MPQTNNFEYFGIKKQPAFMRSGALLGGELQAKNCRRLRLQSTFFDDGIEARFFEGTGRIYDSFTIGGWTGGHEELQDLSAFKTP